MRILILGINYWPEETGIAAFTTGRAEYLAARGHDVTVCTGFAYYPQWRVADPYRGRLVARERRNGVQILRSWLYVPSRVTTARRVVHEASFVTSGTLRAAAATRPDLLVTVSPPLGLALSSVLLSRWALGRHRPPFVFHVPDLQPDAAVDLGMLRRGAAVRLLYALERLAYRRAALVTTLTAAMRHRILQKGIAAEKVALLPDWAEPGLFALPLEGGGQAARQRLGLGQSFLVVHVGNMGVKQGLGVVLDAAARSRTGRGVLYVLVGDGAARPDLEAHVAAAGLDNVRILPLQPRSVFQDLLAAADLALVTQQRVVADIVFPSKVLTLLAAGRPVVASLNAGSEVARVVTEAGAGVVVPAEEPAALEEAVLALRADPERRRQMRLRGREYARLHWDRDALLSEMERLFTEVVRGPEPSPTARDRADHLAAARHAR